ncbi:MAG: helix-turn-helix transcriptional regulator [Actinobacteria bacterium]|nr:helix-turn-helix transcriptional regulator [Actinomycetota bacterium]MBS1883957.1 helix-turn-helix transcriptional regulator [Actinomycetota bacterium]
MSNTMKRAFEVAGLDRTVDPNLLQPHELPKGSKPPLSLAGAGLDPDEIVPGLVALRMDPSLLLDDDRVCAPQERELLGIVPFVCLEVMDDSGETIWAALTEKPARRLAIKPGWRRGGNARWKTRPLFLLDARADRCWVGPKVAFVTAAWREALTDLEHACLTPEGLKAVRGKVNRGDPKSIPVAWEDLARSFVHPLRISILEVLGLDGGRILSPNDLSQELQVSLGTVNYHVTELAKATLIVLADEKPVRGAVEHFYCLAEAPIEGENEATSARGDH